MTRLIYIKLKDVIYEDIFQKSSICTFDIPKTQKYNSNVIVSYSFELIYAESEDGSGNCFSTPQFHNARYSFFVKFQKTFVWACL
jgi:hypothetical protein